MAHKLVEKCVAVRSRAVATLFLDDPAREHIEITGARVQSDEHARTDAWVRAKIAALAVEPANARAINVLTEMYSAEENWSALVRLYQGALKARSRAGMSKDAEEAMHLSIALVLWTRLDQLDAAEEYFRRVRTLDPTHDAMLSFYRAYHGDRS